MTTAAGCWPNETQALLLTAALADADTAAAAWLAWHAQAGVQAVDQASLRLLPLVYLNLADRGVLGAEEPRLRGVYRQNWARNHRRIHGAAKAIAALAGAGIATLGLKGLVLTRYYGNVGARSMADVDIVTPVDAIDRAVAVLENVGWRLCHPPLARERRRGSSSPMITAAGDELDLHWHVLHVQPFRTVDDEFWQGSEPIEIGGVPLRALQPADELLHTIVHGLHWNPINSLRWIADAVTLLRRTPHLDWDRLLASAERYSLVYPVRIALDHLGRYAGVAVPDRVAREARRLRAATGDRVEWWARMRGPAMPPGPLGYVVRYWRQYRRLRRAGVPEAPPGFVRYVADSLRVDGAGQLALAVARQTRARMAWRQSN